MPESGVKAKPKQLFDELGGVIQTRIRCATLSLSALKKALEKPAHESAAGSV